MIERQVEHMYSAEQQQEALEQLSGTNIDEDQNRRHRIFVKRSVGERATWAPKELPRVCTGHLLAEMDNQVQRISTVGGFVFFPGEQVSADAGALAEHPTFGSVPRSGFKKRELLTCAGVQRRHEVEHQHIF